jgi:hypothetical protein
MAPQTSTLLCPFVRKDPLMRPTFDPSPSPFLRLARLAPVVALAVATGCGAQSPPMAASVAAPTKADPDYDTLCAGVAPETQAKCPMGAWARAVDDVDGGVLLHLNASAPPPDETERDMRCHRAWMAHDAANAMPRCPLGSPGIAIKASRGATGTDLSLLASKPEDVREVRRRAHAALEK